MNLTKNQINIIIAIVVAIVMTIAIFYYPMQYPISEAVGRVSTLQEIERSVLVNFGLELFARMIELGILVMTLFIVGDFVYRRRIEKIKGGN